MDSFTKPNLFNFATKELSLDAVVAWLIQWADDRYAGDNDKEGLHELGRVFVRGLLSKHGVAPPECIETRILTQDKNIDVLARVGPKHVLLIEDKTEGKSSDGQLKKYYRQVVEGQTGLGQVQKEWIYPIFLKTGNQSMEKDRLIETAVDGLHRPYRVFNRRDLLDVLDSYEGTNSTVLEFREYQAAWEADTNGFSTWSENERNDWSWDSWRGFFRHLDRHVRRSGGWSDWEYVSNRRGGFMGFWWNFNQLDTGGDMYLQLEVVVHRREQQKLCFKVGSVEKARQSEQKWESHGWVIEAGGGRVVKPDYMRVGDSMTVGHWNGEWLEFRDGQIDLDRTLANLREAEGILCQAVSDNQ